MYVLFHSIVLFWFAMCLLKFGLACSCNRGNGATTEVGAGSYEASFEVVVVWTKQMPLFAGTSACVCVCVSV